MNTYCYSIQCNSVSAARNKVSSKELLAQFPSPARNRYKVHLQSLRRPVFLLHMLDKSLTVGINSLVYPRSTVLSTVFVRRSDASQSYSAVNQLDENHLCSLLDRLIQIQIARGRYMLQSR